MILSEAFHSGLHRQSVEVARRGLRSGADGVLVVAGAGDAAILCQQYRRIGGRDAMFSSGWAMRDGSLRAGGSPVEAAVFRHGFDQDSRAPDLPADEGVRSDLGATPTLSQFTLTGLLAFFLISSDPLVLPDP